MSKKINTSGPSSGFIADPTITPFPINWNRLNKIRFEDAPTDYILLCKLTEKYNEIVDSTNSLEEAMEQFMVWAYETLEDAAINKLNEWINDGTLSNIFKQVIGIFDTVNELINDESAVIGKFCVTLGYYKKEDGGGTAWIITNEEPETYHVQLSNGLYAKKVYKKENNILEFGIVSNKDEDQSTAIQQAINESDTLFMNDGIYFVKLSDPYTLISHDNLKLKGNKTVIKGIGAVTNENGKYVIFQASSNHVTIESITFDGTKELVTEVGEFGHGLYITGSNINVLGVTVQACFGDGIVIDGEADMVNVINCTLNENRRNGFTVLSGSNINATNNIINNTGGTAPGAGICIEPYEAVNLYNINIKNSRITGCEIGIDIYLDLLTYSESITCLIENTTLLNNDIGLQLKKAATKGSIIIVNTEINNSNEKSIEIEDWSAAYMPTKISNASILNYTTTNAVTISATTQNTYDVIFENLLFDASEHTEQIVFNTGNFSTYRIKIKTNANYIKNWWLQNALEIDNGVFYTEAGILDLTNRFFSIIEANPSAGRITIQPPSLSSSVTKTPKTKLIFISNGILAFPNLVKTSSQVGTGGFSVPTKGCVIEITGITNQFAPTLITGNVSAWNG